MSLNANHCWIEHAGSKNQSTVVVYFIVSRQEEKQGFNVDRSMKTDAHCIAEATELHTYAAKEGTQFQCIRQDKNG